MRTLQYLYFLCLGFWLISCEEPFEHQKYQTEYAEDTKINISQIIGPNGPVGFIHEWAVVRDESTREVYRVYDVNEVERGFMLEEGATYQYDKFGGNPVYLNQYNLEEGSRHILNIKEKVRLVRPTPELWKPKAEIKSKKKKAETAEEE